MAKFDYMLVPKSGKGPVWYANARNIFCGADLLKVFSKDGFETIIDIKQYVIIKL